MHLRAWITLNKLTLIELSKTLDCDVAYLSRMINGHVIPGRRFMKDIVVLTKGKVTAVDFNQMALIETKIMELKAKLEILEKEKMNTHQIFN
jgi:hypothetical protein